MSAGSQTSAGLTLLRLLHGVLSTDPGTPPFAGRLGIGVRGAGGEHWLVVELAERAAASIEEARPDGADATLLLGEADAQVLLESGRLPEAPKLLLAAGDRRRLGLFFERYQPKLRWGVSRR
ncbi:MAG: hypothetical protein IT384_34965 [Deltaproteobacteria bacterium]|nr:hypothetical protein [Deltaproteobacteria bacterium]